jgi:hypothetical protein
MDEQKLKSGLLNYLETGAEEELSKLLLIHGLTSALPVIVDFLTAFCKISDEVCPILLTGENTP